MKIIVSFIFIGAGRTGTTWFYHALKKSKYINLGKGKEVNFFNLFSHKGIDWYHSHFNNHDALLGEISNNYYIDNEALLKIKKYNPDIKLIYTIRKPEDLAVSIYKFSIRRNINFSSLKIFLNTPIMKIMGSTGMKDEYMKNISVYDSLNFMNFYKNILEIFNKNNVKIIDYESFFSDPKKNIRFLFKYLEINEEKIENIDLPSAINASAQSRFPGMGAFSSRIIYFLRKWGWSDLVDKLKSSQFLWNIVFKKTNNSPSALEKEIFLYVKNDLLLQDSFKELIKISEKD